MSRRKTERDGGDFKRREDVTRKAVKAKGLRLAVTMWHLLQAFFYDDTAICNAKDGERQGNKR